MFARAHNVMMLLHAMQCHQAVLCHALSDSAVLHQAIAAGVRDITEEKDLHELVTECKTDKLIVVFWGGKWCR